MILRSIGILFLVFSFSAIAKGKKLKKTNLSQTHYAFNSNIKLRSGQSVSLPDKLTVTHGGFGHEHSDEGDDSYTILQLKKGKEHFRMLVFTKSNSGNEQTWKEFDFLFTKVLDAEPIDPNESSLEFSVKKVGQK